MNKLKIGVLYFLLSAGGLWHILDVLQGTMRVFVSPMMFGLAIWLFWECWRVYPASERSKFALMSTSVIVGSFGIEWLGVRTGAIFGVYLYGQALRPAMGGVPISIGCAWFVMLIASTAVAQKIAPKVLAESRFKLAFLVALLMVCFDLLMEPAAVKLNYWMWMDNHIPLQNYLVWFGLSFIFATIGLQTGVFRRQLPRIAVHFYFAQLAYFGLAVLKN